MLNVQDADAQFPGTPPLFLRPLRRLRRQEIFRNISRNPERFQFLTTAAQHTLRSLEVPDQQVGGSQAKTTDKCHTQNQLRALNIFHGLERSNFKSTQGKRGQTWRDYSFPNFRLWDAGTSKKIHRLEIWE
jgi:hypothetical protein